MGLILDKLKQLELSSNNTQNSSQNNKVNNQNKVSKSYQACVKFPDLDSMPPELSLQILKYLNATDLCLASCVWSSLASDDILWQGLCKSTWGYASCYNKRYITNKNSINDYNSCQLVPKRTFRKIFMHLDEATLTFNSDWKKGLEYLFKENLVENDPMEIAKFINSTKKLLPEQKEKLFKENKAILDNIVKLHNYENQFLPTALRRFFSKIEAPKERNSYLSLLLEKFSKRFISCNPQIGLTEDAVYILCFSLILLSVDLSSPAVKNKMSKREFIKNTRNALPDLNADFTGHLYDNIYLNGNIAKAARLDEELVSVH